MKFYYFYDYSSNLSDAVKKKVLSQCTHLAKIGVDANLIFIGEGKIEDLSPEFVKSIIISELNPSIQLNILARLKRQYELRKIFVNIIESASFSEIVYTRYQYPLFYLLWPFTRRPRRCKIVNEHNSIEQKEFKITGSRLLLLIDLLVGNLMRRKADGLVGVTDEITSHEVMRSGDLNKSHITIGNGIDVATIKVRKPPSFIGEELQLLCVASFSRWHGIDRLLRGLALYKSHINVCLYIVGDGVEIPNLRQIVKDLKIDDKVIFKGILDGSILDDLFDQSHIAIGSLGLHRMEMKEASILKAREYCARGIPFLYGSSDPDFPNDFPYILKVPGDESPINIEEVICFAEKAYSDPEHHTKMRAYAEEKLDWTVKMKKLKDFLNTLFEE